MKLMRCRSRLQLQGSTTERRQRQPRGPVEGFASASSQFFTMRLAVLQRRPRAFVLKAW
jgi:hypothetical protein